MSTAPPVYFPSQLKWAISQRGELVLFFFIVFYRNLLDKIFFYLRRNKC